jgi:predicted RecA/RadA family phage recombinase
VKNFVQEGIVLSAVIPAAVKSGDLTHVGSIVGIAASDYEIGDTGELRCEGVFEIPKITASDVLNQGSIAKATFTSGVGKIGAAGANTVGWVTENSGAGVTTVRVRLIPGTAAVTVAAAAEEKHRKAG